MFFLADGAMGTELIRRGLPPSACLEAQNAQCPDLVSAIHAEYRTAGAEILTTNTFGANRFRLQSHQLTHRVRELNRAGARLALGQANGALVAGSIGPSGEQAERPHTELLRAAFREQAKALHDGGVDLFLCETFGDVDELIAAIHGIRDVSPRPILAQMTYKESGHTPLGLEPGEVAAALGELPISALGVNCAVGSATSERVLEELRRATDLPLIAQPNAGQPVKRDGTLHYPLGPEAFANLAARLLPYVSILGGCCGTTPTHTAEVHHRRRISAAVSRE